MPKGVWKKVKINYINIEQFRVQLKIDNEISEINYYSTESKNIRIIINDESNKG